MRQILLSYVPRIQIMWCVVVVLLAVGTATPAGEALFLLLRETPKPNYGVPVPATVSGSVIHNVDGTSTGVEGVSVSDGYTVVKTNAGGAYTLNASPSAVFISITRGAQMNAMIQQSRQVRPRSCRSDERSPFPIFLYIITSFMIAF